MQRVVEYNYSVQARLLGFHAARRMRAAEMGAFEPSVVTSGQFMDTQRPLTTQIERATGLSSLLGQQDVFMERNKNYSSALEMLTPSGARMRVGVTARQLDNNLDDSQSLIQGTEYETGVGVSMEQPLLKGRGSRPVLRAGVEQEQEFHLLSSLCTCRSLTAR